MLHAVVVSDVQPAAFVALGTSPTGPINRYWLSVLAEVDSVAKRKLSNDMVHVRTGTLRSSQQTPFVMVAGGKLVGVAQNIAKYARYVHDGTKPHEIRPRHGKLLAGWSHNGAPVFTPLVNHPGTKARPWLRDALSEVMARRA